MAGRCRLCLAGGIDMPALSGADVCRLHASSDAAEAHGAGGGTHRLTVVSGDFPIALRNTFLEVRGPRSTEHARTLRRNLTDGDTPVSTEAHTVANALHETRRRETDSEQDDRCAVCMEHITDGSLAWPRCLQPHRLHEQCLGGMLASLLGWPPDRPTDEQIAATVRDCLADTPHGLSCHSCRNTWSDVDEIACAVRSLSEWPRPARSQPSQTHQPSIDARPERQLIPPVYCSSGQEEMDWTTYRRRIRDASSPQAGEQGAWEGEFQCTGLACAGNHLAPPQPIGVPCLWRVASPPRGALPPCQCGVSALLPVLLHGNNVQGQSEWRARWHCYACGIHTRAIESTVDVSIWLLAAERLSASDWQRASETRTESAFWSAVRDCAQTMVRSFRGSLSLDFATVGPPEQVSQPTNSCFFVPLLLDAASLLHAEAATAWRQHSIFGPLWSNWVQQLQRAPATSMFALAEAHAEEVRRSEQPLNLGRDLDVSLLWRSAARASPGDTLVALNDIVLNSRNQQGYIPGLAQEVLLNSFGGQYMCREMLDAIALLRRSQPSLASSSPQQANQTGLTQMISEMDVVMKVPRSCSLSLPASIDPHVAAGRIRPQPSCVAPCVVTVERTKPETAGDYFSIWFACTWVKCFLKKR